MPKKTKISGQERAEIISHTILSSQSKTTKCDPMGDGNLRYIQKPDPIVYHLMVTHDVDRKTAERIANFL